MAKAKGSELSVQEMLVKQLVLACKKLPHFTIYGPFKSSSIMDMVRYEFRIISEDFGVWVRRARKPGRIAPHRSLCVTVWPEAIVLVALVQWKTKEYDKKVRFDLCSDQCEADVAKFITDYWEHPFPSNWMAG